MRRLIVFLVRLRLGLKKYEHFVFTNQNSNAVYYFTEIGIVKKELNKGHWITRRSRVSLNWLLDPDCKVKPVQDETQCSNRKEDAE